MDSHRQFLLIDNKIAYPLEAAMSDGEKILLDEGPLPDGLPDIGQYIYLSYIGREFHGIYTGFFVGLKKGGNSFYITDGGRVAVVPLYQGMIHLSIDSLEAYLYKRLVDSIENLLTDEEHIVMYRPDYGYHTNCFDDRRIVGSISYDGLYSTKQEKVDFNNLNGSLIFHGDSYREVTILSIDARFNATIKYKDTSKIAICKSYSLLAGSKTTVLRRLLMSRNLRLKNIGYRLCVTSKNTETFIPPTHPLPMSIAEYVEDAIYASLLKHEHDFYSSSFILEWVDFEGTYLCRIILAKLKLAYITKNCFLLQLNDKRDIVTAVIKKALSGLVLCLKNKNDSKYLPALDMLVFECDDESYKDNMSEHLKYELVKY